MSEFKELEFEVGCTDTIEAMQLQKAYVPFAEETVLLLSRFSETLRKRTDLNTMPDVAAFAFWCRKNRILQYQKEYESKLHHTLGKGVTLHFAPSNIPVLFAFSFTAALLAGNCVLVRLSSRRTPQSNAIIESLILTLKELPEWKPRIALFRYEYNREVTDWLTSLCDVRILWGGDLAIQEIRKSGLPSRATEIPFADRKSVALLFAASILATEDITEVVRGFYNDTYLNDQNACSSPGILYWIGEKEEVKAAKEKFWDEVERFVEPRYVLQPILVVKKWEQAFAIAAMTPGVQIKQTSNASIRVEVPFLKEESIQELVPGGFFVEAWGETMEGILPVLTRKCQTVTTFGGNRDQIVEYFIEKQICGVDRVVEMGHALDFSLVWDGIDLIESMMRRISTL